MPGNEDSFDPMKLIEMAPDMEWVMIHMGQHISEVMLKHDLSVREREAFLSAAPSIKSCWKEFVRVKVEKAVDDTIEKILDEG